MNYRQQLNAYANTHTQGEDVRDTEARALLRCASKLESAQVPGVTYNDYCEAVRNNQKLWTIFQASLMGDDHQMPDDLKKILKSLSVYVDNRSMRAISEFDPNLLSVLVNINKQIAAGLNAQKEREAQEKQGGTSVAPPPAQSAKQLTTSA